MKTVALAAGVVLVIVVIGVVASVVRRRSTDDVHSVEGYRQTLHTLQGIRSRPPLADRRVGGNRPEFSEGPAHRDERDEGRLEGPVVRAPLEDAEAPQGAGGTGTADRDKDGEGTRGSRRPVGPAPSGIAPRAQSPVRRALVFGDAHASADTSLPISGGRQKPISSIERAPRRMGTPVAIALVILAVVVAVVIVGLKSHHHPPASASSGSKSGKGGGSSHHESTTTVPARYTASTFTQSSATYVPSSPNYSLEVAAPTGACWVSVTSSGGSSVFEGTLTTAASKSLTMTGDATVVIGAPSVVAVSISGIPVVLPAGAQAPFTMSIAPRAAGSG